MSDLGKIFIVRKGRREGPFSPQALQAAVRIGTVDRKVAALVGSNPTWRTVGSIIDKLPPALPALGSPPDNRALSTRALSYEGGLPMVAPRSNRQVASRKPTTVAVIILAMMIFAAILKDGQNAASEPDNGSLSEQSPAAAPSHAAIGKTAEEQRKSVLLVRTPHSSSSGFIANIDGKYFAYTSVHCIDSQNIAFFDHLGRRVAVREPVEVVAPSSGQGVDIARMRLAARPDFGLRFAKEGEFAARQEVFALGDSGGEGVLLSLPGRIVGVGPFKVEVDCEFVPGNSGGPIVTEDGRVVGIASYLTTDQTIWGRGTQHSVRRFGWIPGRDYDWVALTLVELVGEKELVEHSMVTTWFLSVLAELRMTKNGFDGMEEAIMDSDWIGSVEEFARHPLVGGFLRTNEVLAALAEREGEVGNALALREYLRFLRSCVVFAEGEIEQLAGLRSAFWSGNLREDPAVKRRVVRRFGALVDAYARTPRYGIRLVD